MTTARLVRIALMALMLALGLAAQAPRAAENSERCEGTVTDDAGNPLAGVTISFLNLQTSIPAQPVKTSKKGKYAHNFLAAGREPGWEMRATLEGYKIVKVKVHTTSQDGTTVGNDEYMVGGKQELHNVPVPAQARQIPGSKGVCIVDYVLVPEDRHTEVFQKLRQELLAKQGGAPDAGAAPAAGAAPTPAAQAPSAPAAAKVDPYEAGVRLFESNDFPGAVERFREAIAADPGGADKHRMLGLALLKAEVLPEAEAELKKSLELDPETQGANFDLGMLYIKKSRMMQAIPYMEKEHQLNTEAIPPLQNLAGLYADTQQFDKAIEAYEKLLALAPDNLEAYSRLAEAYKASGNAAKEQEVYQRMGEQDSTGMAFYNLGNILFNKSEMERAADAYRKAIVQAPDNAQAHYQLGMVYVNLAKFKEAITELETFAKLKPKDPRAVEAKSLVADLRKMSGG